MELKIILLTFFIVLDITARRLLKHVTQVYSVLCTIHGRMQETQSVRKQYPND